MTTTRDEDASTWARLTDEQRRVLRAQVARIVAASQEKAPEGRPADAF